MDINNSNKNKNNLDKIYITKSLTSSHQNNLSILSNRKIIITTSKESMEMIRLENVYKKIFLKKVCIK